MESIQTFAMAVAFSFLLANDVSCQTQANTSIVHSESTFNPNALRKGIASKWIGLGVSGVGIVLGVPPISIAGSCISLTGLVVQDVQTSRLAKAHATVKGPSNANGVVRTQSAEFQVAEMGLHPAGIPRKNQSVFVIVDGELLQGKCVFPGAEFSKVFIESTGKSKRIVNRQIYVSYSE